MFYQDKLKLRSVIFGLTHVMEFFFLHLLITNNGNILDT